VTDPARTPISRARKRAAPAGSPDTRASALLLASNRPTRDAPAGTLDHSVAAAAAPVPERDPHARVLDRSLAPRAPARATHDDQGETGTRIYERWWFWTALGVVAVGGGITAGLLLDDNSAPPPGSLGTVRWD
jgi:hypothetical protein